jgi:predicted RecB family nuclease
MAKGFSASTIKSWFQYRCERKVRYELSSDTELAEVPIAKDVREQTWAVLGTKFEEQVVRRLARQDRVLKPTSGDNVLSEVLTGAFLKGHRNETYAAQVNLRPNTAPSFLDGTGLFLNRNLADLLRREPSEVPGRTEITIIDIKATRRATAFHKTQVAFYARVLEALLLEMKLPGTSISQNGEIWRIADDSTVMSDRWQVETFALAPYLRLVDDFCANVLPTIAAKQVGPGVDETFFHLYFKCEQCSFLEHCRKTIASDLSPDRRDVSAVPGLTHEGKRSLNRLGVYSIGGLSRAVGLAQAPGISWSLGRRAPQLTARAKALATDNILRTEEQQTYLMPPRIDTALLLSVDHDPIDDRIAAIGYRRVDGAKIIREVVRIPETGALTDELFAIIDVLSALIADLTSIDDHNASLGGENDHQAIYAHILFYEPSEATNLQAAIGRHLGDERIRNGLLHLVRLFPPEDVVPEPEFRGIHHLPATALRSVFEQLWALPVSVAYDIRQVSQVLFPVAAGPAYVPAEGFARPFSSLLSIDVIRELREHSTPSVSFEAIVRDVAGRFNAMQALIGWLLEENRKAATLGSPLLRLAKQPFRFQATFDPLNAVDLDVLLACELLENRAGMLETLVGLARPAPRRRDAGRCYAGLSLERYRSDGGRSFLLFHVPPESRAAELGSDDFDLILTDDAADIRLNPGLWSQFSCRIRKPSATRPSRPDVLHVEMMRKIFEGQEFQQLLQKTPQSGWFIDKAFFDVNTDRAAAFLSYLARGDNA